MEERGIFLVGSPKTKMTGFPSPPIHPRRPSNAYSIPTFSSPEKINLETPLTL